MRKAIRYILTVITSASIFLSAISIGETQNIKSMVVFALSMFVALLIVKTSKTA